jgi:site-specific DNA-cytosine methylase
LQVFGVEFEVLGCSDPKLSSQSIIKDNWSHVVTHFHDTMAAQLAGEPCCLHPNSSGCNVTEHVKDVDVAIIGTSCRPFSKQRAKRFSDGSVKDHKDVSLTFEDLTNFIADNEPISLIAEQVEAFDRKESSKVDETPLQQLIAILSKIKWKKGGYLIRVFNMDAKFWMKLSRPRQTFASWFCCCVVVM